MKFIQFSDEELLKAIQSGDEKRRNHAFRQLYMDQQLENKIKAMAADRGLTKKTHDDILQEGIILLDNLIREGRFEGRSKVTTFLVALCRNLIRDTNKKVDRIELKETFQDADLKKMTDEAVPSIELIELNEAEQKRDNTLGRLLREMTDKCRKAITLFYYEGKSLSEISEEPEFTNYKQTKKKMYTCREQLRKLILKNPTLIQLLKLKK